MVNFDDEKLIYSRQAPQSPDAPQSVASSSWLLTPSKQVSRMYKMIWMMYRYKLWDVQFLDFKPFLLVNEYHEIITFVTIMIINAWSNIWKHNWRSFQTKLKPPSIASKIYNSSTIQIVHASKFGFIKSWVVAINSFVIWANTPFKSVFKAGCYKILTW